MLIKQTIIYQTLIKNLPLTTTLDPYPLISDNLFDFFLVIFLEVLFLLFFLEVLFLLRYFGLYIFNFLELSGPIVSISLLEIFLK